jgi:ADP-ribose pyrophosphatase
MMDIKVINSQVLFDNPYAKVIIDTLEYDGIQHQYFYVTSPVDAVATVGITDEDCIILTRQYRHPIGKVIYDLPAGHLEPGEEPLAGACREFEEETGYFPRKMEVLGYYNQFPGVLRAGTNLYFASNLVKTRQNLEPGEILETAHLPVREVLDWIRNGKMIDGSLQLGVLLALMKGFLNSALGIDDNQLHVVKDK